MISFRFLLSASLLWMTVTIAHMVERSASGSELSEEAIAAAKKATTFLTEQVSTQGGYLWRYSADLKLREGEGVVDSETVWVQPPGTPAVGEAFVRLYELTGDRLFLNAAKAAGEALRRGQMRSGGWQAMVEFEPNRRGRWAYRIDQPRQNAKDQSSLDDDKTQSALRFVMQLDRALKFQDEGIHEMALYALDGLLKKGQLSNGGFPQIWTSQRVEPIGSRTAAASYPPSWPQTYPGHQEYWHRYTLNDNLAPDVVRTLIMADEIYENSGAATSRYLVAAFRFAYSLLLAQMPEPQPAWAQQYGFDMQPIWARKFEPAAITGGESQGVIETLMLVYSTTGDRQFLEPIPRALDYLKRSELPDGRLARFYELKTNRPLYFSKTYQLTYDDANVPTHYAFKVRSRIDKLRASYDELAQQPFQVRTKQLRGYLTSHAAVRRVLLGMDQRGAWVTKEGLRYHKQPGPVVDMRVAVANLHTLADYIADGLGQR